jgi:hypothetical protein
MYSLAETKNIIADTLQKESLTADKTTDYSNIDIAHLRAITGQN